MIAVQMVRSFSRVGNESPRPRSYYIIIIIYVVRLYVMRPLSNSAGGAVQRLCGDIFKTQPVKQNAR